MKTTFHHVNSIENTIRFEVKEYVYYDIRTVRSGMPFENDCWKVLPQNEKH